MGERGIKLYVIPFAAIFAGNVASPVPFRDTVRGLVIWRKSTWESFYDCCCECSWKYSLDYGFIFTFVVFQRRIMFRVTISIRSITQLCSFHRESETK